MNYADLIKEAFFLTLRNRYLWFFGFFVGAVGVGGGGSFNAGSPPSNPGGDSEGRGAGEFDSVLVFAVQELQRWVLDNVVLVVTVGVIVALIALFLLALGAISNGALAEGVAAIDRGEGRGFSSALRAGLSNFWRVLGLVVVFFLIWAVLFIAIVAPLMLLFMAVAPGSLVSQAFAIFNALFFATLLVTAIFIPLGIIGRFALRGLVVRGERVFASIGSGYRLFRRNLGRSLLVWLIQVALAIGAGFVFTLAVLIVGLVLAIPGIVLVIAGSTSAAIAAFVIAGLILLPLIVLVVAALATFYHSYWTLAYLRLTVSAEEAPRPDRRGA